MSEFVFPCADSKPLGNSEADRVSVNLWLDGIRETKIYVGENPYDGLATDTLLNLREWR